MIVGRCLSRWRSGEPARKLEPVSMEFDISVQEPTRGGAREQIVIRPGVPFRFDQLVIPPGVGRLFRVQVATGIQSGVKLAEKNSGSPPESTDFLPGTEYNVRRNLLTVTAPVSGYPQTGFSIIGPEREIIVTVINCCDEDARFFGWLAGRGVL